MSINQFYLTLTKSKEILKCVLLIIKIKTEQILTIR